MQGLGQLCGPSFLVAKTGQHRAKGSQLNHRVCCPSGLLAVRDKSSFLQDRLLDAHNND